jgi:tetratricopeptide (TPR) repeat protein
VAESLNTLALIYQNQGCYEEALRCAQQALVIREQALGSNHPDVAESLTTLVRVYEAQGQEAEALPLLQRAVTIRKHVLPEHPTTTATEEHLAALLHQLGRTEAASPCELDPADGTCGTLIEQKLA